MTIELPVDYRTLDWRKGETRAVRDEYVKRQDGKCMWCDGALDVPPVMDREINLSLFPDGFMDHPVHLQHDHDTGMTEGAVHAYCNAVMWQYFGR